MERFLFSARLCVPVDILELIKWILYRQWGLLACTCTALYNHQPNSVNILSNINFTLCPALLKIMHAHLYLSSLLLSLHFLWVPCRCSLFPSKRARTKHPTCNWIGNIAPCPLKFFPRWGFFSKAGEVKGVENEAHNAQNPGTVSY